MSAQDDQVRSLLRKDTRYKRLKSTFDTSDLFQIPFDEYKDELKMLHKTRMIHKLSPGHPNFVKNLTEAAIKDTTNRHRYSEILVSATEAHVSLGKMIEAFESYFLVRYSQDMKHIRTKEERKAFIKAVMNKFHEYLNDTHELITILKIYLEDIDKASFTVKHLIDAFQILAKRDYTEIG